MIQISKEQISKALNESLKLLLNEEGGIASLVTDDSYKVSSFIRQKIKETKPMKFEGYTFRHIDFQYILFEQLETEISINFYNFKTYAAYDSIGSTMSFGAASSFEDRKIELSFFAIGGEIDDRTLNEQLQHEISHLYRAFKKGNVLLNQKRTSLYNFAASKLNSTNQYESMIANIIYMSFDEEQNAFANGLYSLMLKNIYEYQPRDIYQQSAAKQILEKLTYYDKLVSNNMLDDDDINSINQILRQVKLDYSWIQKKLPSILHEFSKKTARALYMANEEYKKSHMTRLG